jgi:endonuclease/exonuclease/phosphatase family metal-dependent hydrolase
MIRAALLACLLAFPASAEPLKISTWNLDWLTARSHAEAQLPADVHVRAPEDFATLAAYARKLAADIVAFQEVDGPQAAALVFDAARYTIVTTNQTVVQRVGLAVRHDIGITRHPDYAALDVEATAHFPLRDGLDVTLALPSGHELRVLVIHLKTGCQTEDLERPTRPQCVLLAHQIAPLAAWATARRTEGVPFLILGDFNRVLDDPEPLGDALQEAAPLTRVTEGFANPCWEGDAFIDHILVGGPARAWVVPASLRVQVFQEPVSQKAHLSDHCPVSFKLDPARP